MLPRDCAHGVELEINPANRLEARARGERWEEHQPPLTAIADFLQCQHVRRSVSAGGGGVEDRVECDSSAGGRRWVENTER